MKIYLKIIKSTFWLILVLLLATRTALAIEEQVPFPPSNLPDLLGWVSLPACSSLCCGYFRDPLAPYGKLSLPPITTTALEISASETQFAQTGPSMLSGNVTVTQPGRFLSSEHAVITRDCKTNKPNGVELEGNVELREPGRLIVAEKGNIELQSKAGKLFHAIYHFVLGGPVPFSETELSNPSAPYCPNTECAPLNAWGVAYCVERKETGVIELKHATYSTCAPIAPTWQLNSMKIDLNPNTGRGYAYNTWLDVKGIPVFYTPFISFPLDHKRKTGFLFPSYGHSSRSGYYLATPFYWNIAPNYDATITPNFYTNRGVLTDGLFRYLTSHSSGQVNGGVIFHDRAFADFQQRALIDYPTNLALSRLENSTYNRDYFSWQNATSFNENWSMNINYNSVSDDYVLQDFPTPHLNTLVDNQLPQMAELKYHDCIWTFLAKVQNYQTLHPVNQVAINNIYRSLPELDLNADLPNQACGLHYHFDNQFVYFERSYNPKETISPISASRLSLTPSVSLPINTLSGFFKPELKVNMRHYDVGHQAKGYPNEIQRIIPTFDVDTGLFFDRDVRICNCNYQQTLEPRIFYLYTPYRNQNSIPVFDTALVPFSYDSLFLTNRFSGLDRIGDANQVSVGLTTRFLEENSGAEKFRASIGQIYYFQNRLVTVCGRPGSPSALSGGGICGIDNALGIGATSTTERISPFAAQVAYHFNNCWGFSGNDTWDPNTRETINGNVNLQYSPAPNHIVNLGYNYVRLGDPQPRRPDNIFPPRSHRNDLNQITASLAWPVRERWQVLGSINYNFTHEYPQTYLYGLEYESCCWAARFLAGQTYVGLNQRNNPTFDHVVYFQVQFKGLGNVNTANPASFLVANIPGYQDTFDNFSLFTS